MQRDRDLAVHKPQPISMDVLCEIGLKRLKRGVAQLDHHGAYTIHTQRGHLGSGG